MIKFFYCKRAGNASVQFLKYIYMFSLVVCCYSLHPVNSKVK